MSGRSGCSAPFMPAGGDAQRGWRRLIGQRSVQRDVAIDLVGVFFTNLCGG